MTSPQFDSNTWYSLQNAGNKFYLGCNSISICGADTSDRTNFEWFQITRANSGSPYYIRPKSRNVDEKGQPFCININTGQPALTLCNDASATWGTGYWNERDTGNGLFFFSTQQGNSKRLYLADGGTWSLPDYNGASADDLDHMRWNVASLGAINDQSYSTPPAVIINVGSTAIITASISSTARAMTTLSGTSSAPTESQSSSPRLTSSPEMSASSPALSVSTATTSRTSATVATTATSPSGSNVSATTVATPTSANSARRIVPAMYAFTAIPVMSILLQLMSSLS